MLDRHQVGQKCGTDEAPGMLSSWRMTKRRENHRFLCMGYKDRRFDYHCDSGFWPMDAWKNCHKTATPENVNFVHKTLKYLERHTVACPLGKAMKWWQVFAGAKGKAEGKVEMVCCDIPNYDSGMASEIKHKRSVCVNNIDQTIDYVDQITDVDCGQGNVMTKWRLEHCEGRNMLVEYSCIPVPDLKKKHEGTVLGSRELVRGRVAVQQSLIDPTLA